jgi:amino acid transporter
VAILLMSLFALVLSLVLGWKWGPLVGFSLIATLAVIVVVVVYILICIGCIRYYLTVGRAAFNPVLHLLLPLAGAVLFFFPLWFQYVKFPPTYPIKYANWFAIGWIVAGLGLTALVAARWPERLKDTERVYVDDETVEQEPRVAAAPA